LLHVEVTNGSANGGAGILNFGELAVINSLIDNNDGLAGIGSAILNQGGTAPATLDMINSTVAFNHGGQSTIYTLGNHTNEVTLTNVTLARNTTNSAPAGIDAALGSVSSSGSIFYGNATVSG